MAECDLPTPEELRNLLRYEPETGKLFWLPREGNQSFNTQCAGREALTSISPLGYRRGTVHFKHLRAHRVAWAIHYGEWPDGEIDHINGDRADNRIANLRDVSHTINGRNLRRPLNNSSGVVGVNWQSREKKWRASITVNSKNIWLGEFASFEDAVAARLAAQKRHGFHANHGKR